MMRFGKGLRSVLVVLLLCVAVVLDVVGQVPASYGEVRRVDTPILRVPFMENPPTIDGVMEPGEWDDAASLSGFWYDYGNSHFYFLAPQQTQLQLYAGYDNENLYFCYVSPVYPVDSWLRARGRFPNVLSHPIYGMLWDDHTELELRPVEDLTRGFELGLLRWDVNPIGTVTDWYWSQRKGHDFRWNSQARIRTVADGNRWVVEYAIPLASLRYGQYDDTDEDGNPLVQVPPPDGTAYRAWFVRGIGGNGPFFNVFDNHSWNTTKTMLIFDSQAPVFQINELGPIMDDMIDIQMTVKNHNTRSETIRLGFHVESAEGPIYSSYDSAEIPDGLLELRPGELRRLRLRQPFPGISRDGNVLWFDVRSAGQPARTLFRTRLIRFHSMDGGYKDEQTFRERRIDVIETLRPQRVPFDLRVDFCAHSRRMSVVVDRGIHGASEEVQDAVLARVQVRHISGDGSVVGEGSVPMEGNFGIGVLDMPEIVNGERYVVTVLLFDENTRIVGERTVERPFVQLVEGPDVGRRTDQFLLPHWIGNEIGLEDRVWEPFTPIVQTDEGFETLKHRFTLDASGLPAQIAIRPHERNLPLELRNGGEVPASVLREIGRGDQLRAPMRLIGVFDGEREEAQVVAPAQAVRVGESEIVYASTMRLGAFTVELVTRYDVDGSMHVELVYGSEAPARIDRFELVSDILGTVDLMLSDTGGGGMTGADRWECALPDETGILWDSSLTQMDMFYSRFIPWFWFGSADRGWSYFSDSAEGWVLDRDGSAMDLERNADGDVTWRVTFVNHPVELEGRRSIAFSILTHPAKPKPDNFRRYAWHYNIGPGNMTEYSYGRYDFTDEELIAQWRRAASAPADTPDDQRETWRKDEPPFHRYGWWRNVQMRTPEMDRVFEEKATYYFERFIRIGRRIGWWQDEYWPAGFGVSHNLATGNAWLRDPADVKEDELPWQPVFLTTNMRNHYKRLARVSKKNNVPQRQHTWSNNAARMLESFLWNSVLVEECGAMVRAYDIDLITTFPNSLYRTMGMHFTGLITTLVADLSPAKPGDDLRFDRQRLGIALINDFGVSPNGPHDTFHHKEQGVRLLDRLDTFGYFEEEGLEKLPYWRNDGVVRLGDAPGAETGLRVTVYRRPLEDGRGYKALFVILNESAGDSELPLVIRDPQQVFGGGNTLSRSEALGRAGVPPVLRDAWDMLAADGAADEAVLLDWETGEIVARTGGEGRETYGPVFVPYHDYRILYGHFRDDGDRL